MLSLGFTSSPNDTHIFYAAAHSLIAGAPDFNPVIDDIDSLKNFSENGVSSIKPWGLLEGDEELRSVSVWSSVGHGKSSRSLVSQSEVFISKLFSVDGFASSSVTGGEVTSLAHELSDDTMEAGIFEVQRLTYYMYLY